MDQQELIPQTRLSCLRLIALNVSKEIEYLCEVNTDSDSERYDEIMTSIMDGYHRVKRGSLNLSRQITNH